MKQLFVASSFLPLVLALWSSQAAGSSQASRPPTPEQVKFFELKVRPVLAEHCYACHSAKRQAGGLRLDSRDGLLKGGGSGPTVTPGEPEKSLLIDAVNHKTLQMPPGGKLKGPEIDALTAWVKMGAPWPTPGGQLSGVAGQKGKAVKPTTLWAVQPLRPVEVPVVQDGGWARNDVDRFVFQRLKRAGLTPAPEADRVALIRRVTFDLTGLPPTPEEVDAFLADTSTDAYEKVVDRLLSSPRYGERMARHWLDLVRYADSDGYRADEYRPHAWRYRDYVIKALNEDKPYDRFIQEQLAGDELFPGNPEALVATGYLRHWIYEWNQRDVRGQWDIILNDITDTTGDVFFGLGIQCARCHDHKFDPILQKDYYRLKAFFAPILPREDLPAVTEQELSDYRKRLAVWEQKTAAIREQIAALEKPYREKAAHAAVIMFPPDIQQMIHKPVARREPLEHQLAELAYRQVYFEYDRLETKIKGEDKDRLLALRKQLAAFDREKPELFPTAFAVTDTGPVAPPVYIPKKGKEPIEPGFPALMEKGPAKIERLPGTPSSTGRRSALARWLTRKDNPLTPRVIANRVWQWHFGRGLAANASDFGTLGETPSHPELLDYLASRLVSGDAESGRVGARESGSRKIQTISHSSTPPLPRSPTKPWSLKSLTRLIVTSATYRQGTRHPRAAAYRVKDPENRLYWRGNTRRLDAEQIRDAMLAVTGELDLKTGGPGAQGTEPRRSVYTRVMRNNRDALLDVFDLPLFFTSAASRDTTTTPVQSLLLFNSQAMLLRGRALAERLEKEATGDDRRVTRAYRLAFGRPPRAEEVTKALRFFEEQTRRVDPQEAGSAAAAFLHEKLPYRDGQAARVSPEGPQQRFEIPYHERLDLGDFTIEAFVQARSVYDSGAVRTIAARWDGDTRSPGWGFGITGKQSRRKPQTLVLQLIGRKLDGTLGEEAVFSDHHIQLNKPYYLAAAVKRAANGKPGSVTFFIKDLSNDDEPLQTATVTHSITGGVENRLPLVLGGRSGNREAAFDGLIDDVRLSEGALGSGQILYTAEGATPQTVGYWQFEPKPNVFRDSAGNGLDIRPAAAGSGLDPRRTALADFCHVLLNSSEFLYVD